MGFNGKLRQRCYTGSVLTCFFSETDSYVPCGRLQSLDPRSFKWGFNGRLRQRGYSVSALGSFFSKAGSPCFNEAETYIPCQRDQTSTNLFFVHRVLTRTWWRWLGSSTQPGCSLTWGPMRTVACRMQPWPFPPNSCRHATCYATIRSSPSLYALAIKSRSCVEALQL